LSLFSVATQLTTFIIMTVIITAFGSVTFSIMGLFVTLSISTFVINDTSTSAIMLSVIIQTVAFCLLLC